MGGISSHQCAASSVASDKPQGISDVISEEGQKATRLVAVVNLGHAGKVRGEKPSWIYTVLSTGLGQVNTATTILLPLALGAKIMSLLDMCVVFTV
jgi:hypothetical protein